MPRKHVVKPGEYIASIAWRYGFSDYKKVYDHPDNAALKKKRPNPDVLMPGDEVVIPDLKPKTLTLAGDSSTKILVKLPKRELRLCLKDPDGKPLASEAYVLTIAGDDGGPRKGSTDGDGLLKEKVSIDSKGAKLEVAGRTLTLRFGHLPALPASPDEPLVGVESRLHNLGYVVGTSQTELAADTRIALALFQADQKLEEKGDPDQPTLDKLKDGHGS